MVGSRVRLTWAFLPLIGFMIIFPGCGGGGAGTASGDGLSPSATGAVLEWNPPTVAADGTAMDPQRDLSYYEFYLRTDTNFSDADVPVAQVPSFGEVRSPDGHSFRRTLTTEFPMENLLPFVEPGKRYYVSIRAVGVDGLKSAFMVPVVWDLS